MQVTQTTTTVTFPPLGIKTETEERDVTYLADDMLVISSIGASQGCRFKLMPRDNGVIVVHMADVDLSSGEDTPHTDYCKLPGAKNAVSPHSETVKALFAPARKSAEKKKETGTATPSPTTEPRREMCCGTPRRDGAEKCSVCCDRYDD